MNSANSNHSPAFPEFQGKHYKRTLFAKVCSVILLFSSTLILVHCETLVPRQGWSQRWGPMVPHDTFPGDCSVCHTPGKWNELKDKLDFDHHTETGFELVGAHEEAACLRCHNDRGPVTAYVKRGCGGCHYDPHKSTLGLDCESCHNQDHWEPTGLIQEHATTRMPLMGVHAITPCESCHERATIGEYRGAPTACHSCHRQDAFQAFPNHSINGWTANCERCHNSSGWNTPGFRHDQFPLVGGHAGVDCFSCHAGGRFAGLNTDCFDCHQTDYINAPNHVANGFSTDCTQCHTIYGWR